MPDLVGQSIGPYAIVERIGAGGMATVYKAMHGALGVPRAVKVILPELEPANEFRARFQKEAQSVAALRHSNIVQVHDFGIHNELCFMVMEFIEGADLKRFLKTEIRVRPLRRAVAILGQVASALEYAHERGLIHRDIKPENIMVTPTEQAILTDFGIVKRVAADMHLTQTGMSIGTPAYMSPEQALGHADLSPAADVYALTIVLYEMLTGQVPFKADTPVGVAVKTIKDPLPSPRAQCADIGERLEAVIVKGAAKKPEDRFQSAAEWAAALTQALDADESATAPQSTVSTARPELSRTRRLRTVAIGALAAAGAASGAVIWMANRQPPSARLSDVSPLAATPRVATPSVATPSVVTPTVDTPSVATPSVATPATVPLQSAPPTASPFESREKRGAARATPGVAPALQARASQTGSTRGAVSPSITEQTAAQPVHIEAPVDRAVLIEGPPASSPPPTVQSPAAAPPSDPNSVTRGVTTQKDLLRLFGGPNLTTYDDAGREVWVYERTSMQTDTSQASQSKSASASLGTFFRFLNADASLAKEQSSAAVRTASSVHTMTVLVTFAPDRTVADYHVKATYF